MATDGSTVRLKLPNDARLVAAAAGAVEFVAQRAGLDEAAQRNLTAATTQACRREVEQLAGPDSTYEVFVEDFADRVEVTLEHREPGPASRGGVRRHPQVDDVEFVRDGATARTRLVKYLRGRRP